MAHRLTLLFVVGALVAPTLVKGDDTIATGTLSVTESNDPNETPQTINIAECTGTDKDGNPVTDNLTIHWAFTSFNSGDQVRIDVSNTKDCPTSTTSVYTATLVDPYPGNGATDQYPLSTASTELKPADLIGKLPAAANINCTTGGTIYLCAVNTSATTTEVASGNIVINVGVPAAPTGVTTTSGDGALNVRWTAPSGTTAAARYLIRATATDTALDSKSHDSPQITGNNYRLGGLTNGVTYRVVVYALSQYDNRSEPSAEATGTPQPVDDFWEAYKNAGGVDQGGCATGSAGALAWFLLPWVLLWRRS